MVLNCFDHAFLINADRDVERLSQTLSELQRVNIIAERFPALTPNNRFDSIRPGMAGCALSHCKVIEIAKARGYRNILIFEDDVIFKTDFKAVWSSIVHEVRTLRYDLFYLYDWHRRPQRTQRPAVVRIDGTYCCHAYAVSENYYDMFMGGVLKNICFKAIDQTLYSIRGEKWAIMPTLAGQRAGISTTGDGMRKTRWSAQDR